jgi:hypothetical protein
VEILNFIKDRLGGLGKNKAVKPVSMQDQYTEWQKEISSKSYKKSDIVFFVQRGYEKNEKDTYFMCGYLNNDGCRFRDLSTGEIYDISQVLYPERYEHYLKERDCSRSTISVGGNFFIQINPTILGPAGEFKSRSINIGVADTAISIEHYGCAIVVPNACVLHDTTKNVGRYTRCKKLYELLDKSSNNGVASGIDILKAMNEVNDECRRVIDEVAKKREKEQRDVAEARKRARAIREAGPTMEEKDF